MDAHNETAATWNKVAAVYQDKFMQLDLYNESYNYVCELLKEKSTVLDIGCGPGNITKYLLSKRPDLQIFGIDFAPNMISLAKINNPAADFAVMDCRRIKELTQTFNGIFCGFCLPYLSPDECAGLITDAACLLTENGLIYLSFVEGEATQSGFQVSSTGDRVYFYYHSIQQISALLSEHGFKAPFLFKVAYQKSISEIDTHTILIAERSSSST
jgi:cyclopropane fatty-acyl-phospholipid synthase-like methyltransferase